MWRRKPDLLCSFVNFPVQREADQQSEGGLGFGGAGRWRNSRSGAGGVTAREGAPEGGDPETPGSDTEPAFRNTGS